MKKLLLTSTVLFAMFSTQAYAQEECTALIEQFDKAVTESQASDEAKMKAVEMREQGVKQQAAGDDKACQVSLTEAMQALAG